jgi:hypothetical protein
MTIFYCLRFETPPTWRVRSPHFYPPETGWHSSAPRHWVPFRRLLRLAGLQWRNLNSPPHDRSVKLLLAFVSTVITDFISINFILPKIRMCFEGSVYRCRHYVCRTVVSGRAYTLCHGVQITMDFVHSLSLYNINLHLYKLYRGFRGTWYVVG